MRYVKRWAMIPNIKGTGQKEIDLFAIDPRQGDRYHIETSVSIASGFSALTAAPLEPREHTICGNRAGARRKLDYFVQHTSTSLRANR